MVIMLYARVDNMVMFDPFESEIYNVNISGLYYADDNVLFAENEQSLRDNYAPYC